MRVSEQSTSAGDTNRWIARWENEGGALAREKDRRCESLMPRPNHSRILQAIQSKLIGRLPEK